MALYQPPLFRAPDMAAVDALLVAYPFATLITPVAGDEPVITHLPLLWERAPGTQGALTGHLASANPHARLLTGGPSIAIFHGPHCYVTPSWYTQPEAMVPTWNYAAVHVHGRIELLGGDEKLSCIDRMIARFEGGRATPWSRSLYGEELAAKLRAIVAFRLPVARIDAKFKMSQNRSVEDRAGALRGLRAHGGHDEAAVADWMQAHVSP